MKDILGSMYDKTTRSLIAALERMDMEDGKTCAQALVNQRNDGPAGRCRVSAQWVDHFLSGNLGRCWCPPGYGPLLCGALVESRGTGSSSTGASNQWAGLGQFRL